MNIDHYLARANESEDVTRRLDEDEVLSQIAQVFPFYDVVMSLPNPYLKYPHIRRA